MRRFLGLVILLPLGALAISFGASNGDPVNLHLFPLPGGIEFPLAAVLFATLFVGVIIGGIATWFGAGVVRGRARSAERTARAREIELNEMRRKFADAAATSQFAPTTITQGSTGTDTALPGPDSATTKAA